MMGLSFLVANYILTVELKRKNHFPEHAGTLILFAVLFGVSGSKLLYLFENWAEFTAAPMRMALSPGGLTWFGGFFLATFAIYCYVRWRKMDFGKVCDSAAPALALGYGIARIGCHLAGDGDYGFPTNLPWAAEYSKGTYPPSAAFREFPDLVAKYGVHGVVPDTILVHPVPVYECILGVCIFLVLWNLRKKAWVDYQMFTVYLILAGAARLGVEFVRLNPRYILGLSEAQLIAIPMIIAGVIGFIRLNKPLAVTGSTPA